MTGFVFSIRIERERNVMYISQSGKPSAEDFERMKSEFLAAAEKLESGFVIVNDQRRLEPFDEQALEVAVEIVTLTNQIGVKAVVRIAPADLVAISKLLRALAKAKSNYRTIRVATPEEAEAALAEL